MHHLPRLDSKLSSSQRATVTRIFLSDESGKNRLGLREIVAAVSGTKSQDKFKTQNALVRQDRSPAPSVSAEPRPRGARQRPRKQRNHVAVCCSPRSKQMPAIAAIRMVLYSSQCADRSGGRVDNDGFRKFLPFSGGYFISSQCLKSHTVLHSCNSTVQHLRERKTKEKEKKVRIKYVIYRPSPFPTEK
jgi:hypothetical protein